MYILHLIMALPKITFLPMQKSSHRTHAAGVGRRQEHSLLWTANPSHLGFAWFVETKTFWDQIISRELDFWLEPASVIYLTCKSYSVLEEFLGRFVVVTHIIGRWRETEVVGSECDITLFLLAACMSAHIETWTDELRTPFTADYMPTF